jgi:hypothetical protein
MLSLRQRLLFAKHLQRLLGHWKVVQRLVRTLLEHIGILNTNIKVNELAAYVL